MNARVLAVGFAAIVVLLLARVAVTAWRQASAGGHGADGSRAVAGAARGSPSGWPWPARRSPRSPACGSRSTRERGRDSVPVRSALLGLAVAVAAVAGAVTFGANLLRLVDTPSLYGQTWDVAWDGQFGAVTAKQFSPDHRARAGITDVTFGVHGTVTHRQEPSSSRRSAWRREPAR